MYLLNEKIGIEKRDKVHERNAGFLLIITGCG